MAPRKNATTRKQATKKQTVASKRAEAESSTTLPTPTTVDTTPQQAEVVPTSTEAEVDEVGAEPMETEPTERPSTAETQTQRSSASQGSKRASNVPLKNTQWADMKSSTDPEMNGERYLLDWILEPGNWDRWKTGRDYWGPKLLEGMRGAGIDTTGKTEQSLRYKMNRYQGDFNAALSEWQNTGNSGVANPEGRHESFQQAHDALDEDLSGLPEDQRKTRLEKRTDLEVFLKRHPLFKLLQPVFGERASSNPAYRYQTGRGETRVPEPSPAPSLDAGTPLSESGPMEDVDNAGAREPGPSQPVARVDRPRQNLGRSKVGQQGASDVKLMIETSRQTNEALWAMMESRTQLDKARALPAKLEAYRQLTQSGYSKEQASRMADLELPEEEDDWSDEE